MADRVHPRDSPPPQAPVTVNDETSSESSEPMLTLATRPNPSPDKPVPPPGTYVIHIPKDQVYRVPPPENADRYHALTRKSKTRRRPCCCCLCWFLGVLALIVALVAVSAAIFYLVVKPRSPNYSIDAVSISGVNLTAASSASLTVSPEFDVTVRADNPNKKIGIYYQPKSSVGIYYDDVSLCNGAVPSFYQPSNNVTVFKTALKGSGVVLTSTVKNSLLQAQSQGKVPLLLTVRAPVKIKVGSVKSWTITVKVDCDITVDSLTTNAKILSKDCHYGVKIW
ncbi:hypothetical protein ACB098_08G087600 [Castanea mollissima]|uniref:Late embryogenesis abundant protein LEA-2 subgroup domain-containing protein n=1 Tax=Castanea mollissima TaxID=60419 RepID=A0A8J4VLP3_9ROSI|nr:hypothetical protein CMV_021417 [Castanea mollissima]